MTDPLMASGADGGEGQAERAVIASARQHVGAAGFVQRDVLEHIIVAGREQIAFTRTIRQVVASTRHQLEDRTVGSGDDLQAAALRDIVGYGNEQIEVAEQLHQTIQRTLKEVKATPMEEVSVQVLTVLSETVKRQAGDLDRIIQAAIGEADSPEQISSLRQMEIDTAARLVSNEHDRSERELTTLSVVAQDAAAHIRRLVADGQSHAAQKRTLGQEARVARRDIAALEAAERSSEAEIAHLEHRSEQAQAHIEKLEASAAERLERVEELHAELGEQRQQQRQLEDEASPKSQ